MSSGKKANKRGRALEGAIYGLLEDDYQFVEPKRFFACRELEQPIFTEQCLVGKSIYGKKRKVDFILYHPQRWEECLVIQCKWQASSGSVEEKYPYEVLSIKLNEFKTIIVLDGGGYTKGAEQWLKNQAGKNKLLSVFSLGDIQRYASQSKL